MWVAVGVGVAGGVGVGVWVADGEGVAGGVGVGVWVAVGLAVGVGVDPLQLPLTLNTMCMVEKPMVETSVGPKNPQSTALI